MSSKRSSNLGTMKAVVYQPPGRRQDAKPSSTKCSLRSLADESFLEYNLLKRHSAVVHTTCDTKITDKSTVSVTVPVDKDEEDSKKITMSLSDFFTLTGEVKGIDEIVDEDDTIDDAIESLRATLWAKGKLNIPDGALVTEGKGLKASLELFDFEKNHSKLTEVDPPQDPVERETFDWLLEQSAMKLGSLERFTNSLINRHAPKITAQDARPEGLTSFGERALKNLFALTAYPKSYVEFLWSKESKKNPLMTIKELTSSKCKIFSWCEDLMVVAKDPDFVLALKKEVQVGATGGLPSAEDPVFGKILNLTVSLPGPPGYDVPVASPEADKRIGAIQTLSQTIGLLHAGKHVALLGKVEQGNWLNCILTVSDKSKLLSMTPDQIREFAKDLSKSKGYADRLKALYAKPPDIKFGRQVEVSGMDCFHVASERYEVDLSALATKFKGCGPVKAARPITKIPLPVLPTKEEAEKLSTKVSISQASLENAMEKKLMKLPKPCQEWFKEKDWRKAPLSRINKLYKKLIGPAAATLDRKMFLLNQYKEKLQETETFL